MLELTAVIGDYPHTRPLLDGTVTSDLVSITFVEFRTVNRAFAPMLREQRFDVCEMALGAFLQGVEFGKNVTILPVPLMCGVHHGSLVHVPDRGVATPADLRGKRVGVRSYTQTTGLWLRGILAEEYDIAPSDIEWMVLEEAHVGGYVDPLFVRRVPEGVTLSDLLVAGVIDAAVGVPANPAFDPVVPHVATAERAWFDRHGTVAVNHLVSMRADLAASRPDVVLELYRMFDEARNLGLPEPRHPFDDTPRLAPIGVEGVSAAVHLGVDLAVRQQVIQAPLTIADLMPACLIE
jgi:4,5-dihydroxyphthalate decarboxylase